jgi:hypothetical protein
MSDGGRGKADAEMAKVMERWDGVLGSMVRDGAQWRIDWSDGAAFYTDVELAACMRHGSVREEGTSWI